MQTGISVKKFRRVFGNEFSSVFLYTVEPV